MRIVRLVFWASLLPIFLVVQAVWLLAMIPTVVVFILIPMRRYEWFYAYLGEQTLIVILLWINVMFDCNASPLRKHGISIFG